MQTPSTKVTAAGLGGAVVTILAYVLNAALGIDIPAEVGAAGATVVGFGLGYAVKEQNPANG
jgi:hypothetical protein